MVCIFSLSLTLVPPDGSRDTCHFISISHVTTPRGCPVAQGLFNVGIPNPWVRPKICPLYPYKRVQGRFYLPEGDSALRRSLLRVPPVRRKRVQPSNRFKSELLTPDIESNPPPPNKQHVTQGRLFIVGIPEPVGSAQKYARLNPGINGFWASFTAPKETPPFGAASFGFLSVRRQRVEPISRSESELLTHDIESPPHWGNMAGFTSPKETPPFGVASFGFLSVRRQRLEPISRSENELRTHLNY
ncbi:unnamed protein product [Acanthosepion pharaonis]|uniref:Uncharacterized protein n=1 Tax=Acanthosepion pharaonis TaxID=158019 RepID=A0A812ENX6_ACAPH|nr:unnamed protein product [Sepia pharaonis]